MRKGFLQSRIMNNNNDNNNNENNSNSNNNKNKNVNVNVNVINNKYIDADMKFLER